MIEISPDRFGVIDRAEKLYLNGLPGDIFRYPTRRGYGLECGD